MARESLADVAGKLLSTKPLPDEDETDRDERLAELAGDTPEERADKLTRLIRERHPTRDWKVRSVQDQAARAVGATPPSALEREVKTGDAKTASRARARSRSTRRAGRSLRRRLPTPASPIKGASSVRGLIAQALGLVILFWILRTPGAVTRILAGARRVLEYLVAPRGVPIPQAVLDVAARGAERDEDRHAGPGSPRKRSEEWRPLVVRFFPPAQVDKALRVMACESEGNPNARNPTSGAMGLFQHMPQWWPARSQAAGYAGRSAFDPEANVATAGWLWSRDGWGAWSCGDA